MSPPSRRRIGADASSRDGGPPSSFVLDDKLGHQIDVHPAQFDEHGNGVYRMQNGEDWIYPAAGFAGRGTILGHSVRCLTPEVQMLCHTGYEPSEKDFREVEQIHERFGVEIPEVRRRSTGP